MKLLRCKEISPVEIGRASYRGFISRGLEGIQSDEVLNEADDIPR
jgi:hypothetical protein